jgi:hypothetical protein
MIDTYLVECYWPGVAARDVESALARSTREPDVGFVASILVPEDEIVLCIFAGRSAVAVRASADRAGLPAERIVSCVQVPTRMQPEEQAL